MKDNRMGLVTQSISAEEKGILRELAKQYAELAALDVNKERIQRMRNINDCIEDRPVVWIDEIPWHEMDIDGQLKLHCTHDFARNMEWFFRSNLFRWKYFQADMVLRDCYYIRKSYSSTGIGVNIQENTISTDSKNNIVSHHYEDQLDTEEKLEKLHCPVITADKEADERNAAMAEEILDGILPVKLCGTYASFLPWDQISMLRGVEPVLIDMMERPDFLHKTMQKFVEIGMSQLTQMEEQGLLDYDISSLHCTPPYVSDLPAKDYDGGKVRLKDVWFRGTAQMFSTVSPAMHEEFELQYLKPMFEKCGLVYYGCCEPLDDRIYLLKKIPNMRKIGVSPWANVKSCAEQIGKDYVYARKPNPAMVSTVTDYEAVRKEIRETILACREYGCAYEFVLKDISTVSYRPQNLIDWNKAVQDEINEFYG